MGEGPAAELARRLPVGLYAPPRIESATRGHPVWQLAPRAGWNERLTLQPVPTRQGAWYVAPTALASRTILGLPRAATPPIAFPAAAATEPDKTELGFLLPPLPPIAPEGGFVEK
jgi:hypothetical protein